MESLAQFNSAFSAANARSFSQGTRFVNGGSPGLVPNGGGASSHQQQYLHQQMAGFHPFPFGGGSGPENGGGGLQGGSGQLVMANQLAGLSSQVSGGGGGGAGSPSNVLFAVGDARECVNCGKWTCLMFS